MVPLNPLLPYYETVRLGTISSETSFNHRISRHLYVQRLVFSREDAGSELVRIKFDPPHDGQSDGGNLYDAEVIFSAYQWATEKLPFQRLVEGNYLRGKVNVSASTEPLFTFHGLTPYNGKIARTAAAAVLWRAVLAGNVRAVLPVLKYFEDTQGRDVRPLLPGALGLGSPVEIVSRWEPGATMTAGDDATSISHNVGVQMTVFRIIAGDQLTDPDSTQVNYELQFGTDEGSRMNLRDGTSTVERIPARQNFGSELAAGELGFPLHFSTATKIRGTAAVPTNAGASARPHLMFVGMAGPPEAAIPAFAVSRAVTSGRFDEEVPWARGRTVAQLWDEYFDKGI